MVDNSSLKCLKIVDLKFENWNLKLHKHLQAKKTLSDDSNMSKTFARPNPNRKRFDFLNQNTAHESSISKVQLIPIQVLKKLRFRF